MPVTSCQSNNQDGYKWGPNGKCYTGKDGKAKAEAQGRAIIASGGLSQALSIAKLANVKVSFDYDDTLTTQAMQKLVEKLITAGGTSVYIISARHSATGMYTLATKLGIPMSRVYATGSNKAKVEKVKELGINKHYDNNADVIKELPGIGIKI
jgi:hypothetical protein